VYDAFDFLLELKCRCIYQLRIIYTHIPTRRIHLGQINISTDTCQSDDPHGHGYVGVTMPMTKSESV
jgi:hypothetical protein